MFQKYFRMLITQESGCASGTDCFQNLNSSLKNQKPELFIWNLMVKYWSDRVQSISDFTSAFVNSCCVQVKQGRAGLVLFFPNAFCFKCTYSGLNQFCNCADGKMNNIIILQHQKPWCFSPINLRGQIEYQF